MKIGREGRGSRKVAVISQNRQRQWERLEIERINSRHAGYAALSRIIGYFVVPATSPYGICYGKDLRILFRLLLRLPFPSRGPLAAFLPRPHLGLGGDNSWRDSARSDEVEGEGGSVIEILFTLKGRKSALWNLPSCGGDEGWASWGALRS